MMPQIHSRTHNETTPHQTQHDPRVPDAFLSKPTPTPCFKVPKPALTMAAPSCPPAPVPVYLCGSKPGVFDPTQPARLLRHLDSTLLFASFNPSTSSGASLSTDARRIVVEVTQANDPNDRPHSFSFVPSAGLAPGVVSEGKWPRVVNYCG